MAEWEGFDESAKARIPDGLIDVGGKGMLTIDDELVAAFAESLGAVDDILDKLGALADNVRLNNSEMGDAAATVALLKLTEKMSMTTFGAPLLLARVVTRAAWKEDG